MTKKVGLEFTKNFHVHSASLLLLLLLSTDLAFFVVHIIDITSPFENSRMYLDNKDRSYPEMFQYIKWFWMIALFVYLSVKRKSFSYIAWGLVFVYFLLDDALKFHEDFGAIIANHLTLKHTFRLRYQDIGELVVTGVAGIILFSIIYWAYQCSSRAFKRFSYDMLFLILAVLFFGVFVDMLHSAVHPGHTMDLVFCFIEDGGEMIVASFICWYVFLICVREENNTLGLFDFARSLIVKQH